MIDGMPNKAIYTENKVFVIVSAMMFVMGNTSRQRVNLSADVNSYIFPFDGGKDYTM